MSFVVVIGVPWQIEVLLESTILISEKYVLTDILKNMGILIFVGNLLIKEKYSVLCFSLNKCHEAIGTNMYSSDT